MTVPAAIAMYLKGCGGEMNRFKKEVSTGEKWACIRRNSYLPEQRLGWMFIEDIYDTKAEAMEAASYFPVAYLMPILEVVTKRVPSEIDRELEAED